MPRSRLSPFVALTAFALVACPATAAPIVAGPTHLPSIAIQDITLLPGTPFNPTNAPIFLPGVSGTGFITLNRATQVGSTIPIPTLAGGMFYGSHPALGSYVFGNIPPLTGADFSGQITNVVQDPNDPGFASGSPSSFRSGDFTFGGDSFGFEFLTGPAAGVRLYTDPSVPFEFSAVFDGLPPSPGTLLVNSGPNVLNVTFLGQVVATSSNRRILITPEPASVAVFGMTLAGVVAVRRRRK